MAVFRNPTTKIRLASTNKGRLLFHVFFILFCFVDPGCCQVTLAIGRLSTDNFRLFGGSSPNEGRLQIKGVDSPPEAPWAAVCSGTIDGTVAFALCDRLGYRLACGHGTASAFVDSAVDPATAADLGPIEDVSFACSQNSPYGIDCDLVRVAPSSCTHDQDVWLRCLAEPGDLELRLAGPSSPLSGILEVRCRGNEEWSSVCSGNLWDDRDAAVACRHLGFNFVVVNADAATLPTPVAVSAVGCIGSESNLLECGLGHVTDSCSSLPMITCGTTISEYGSEVGLCGETHQCGPACTQRILTGVRRGCHCDGLCVTLDDCCYDYFAYCKPPSPAATSLNGLPARWYGCEAVLANLDDFVGFYLVNKCPDSWFQQGVRELCEMTAGNQSDIIRVLPVYVNGSLVHYRNAFCAICHGEPYETLISWSVNAIYSDGFGDRPSFVPNFDVLVPGTFSGNFVVRPPGRMGTDGTIRLCPAPAVSSCLDGFRGSRLEAGCKDLIAPMTYRSSNFLNPYCALCNNVTISLIDSCGRQYCETLCDQDPWARCFTRCATANQFLTLDVLFSFKKDGDRIICSSGEVYDPFLDTCRVFYCSPGYEIQGNGCIVMAITSTVATLPQSGGNSTFDYDSNKTANADLVGCLGALFNGSTQLIAYWDADRLNDALEVNFLVQNITVLQNVNDFLAEFSDANWCNVSRAVFYLDFVQVLPVDYCARNYVNGLFPKRFGDVRNKTLLRVSEYNYDSSMTYTFAQIDPTCLAYNLTCAQFIALNGSQYSLSVVGTETTLEYAQSTRIISSDQYALLADGSVVLCSDVLQDTSLTVPQIVNLVLSVLSIIALVLTLAVYSLLRQLRNLAGLAIMNLAGALLIANTLLLLSGYFLDIPALCTAAAPTIHYTWLVSFMWMGALSTNVVRTLSSKVVNKSQLSTTKPLVLYALLSWGVPLIIVGICLVLHFCDCTDAGPIYANDVVCYIVNRDVNLYAFGVPVAVVLLVSFSMFIYTVVYLRRSKGATQRARRETSLQAAKNELSIYARLSVMMGLCWIFGFLTQVIEGQAVILTFIIINSLQGVMIFVSFCLTRRVRDLLRERYQLARRRSGKRRRKLTTRKARTADSGGKVDLILSSTTNDSQVTAKTGSTGV